MALTVSALEFCLELSGSYRVSEVFLARGDRQVFQCCFFFLGGGGGAEEILLLVSPFFRKIGRGSLEKPLAHRVFGFEP